MSDLDPDIERCAIAAHREMNDSMFNDGLIPVRLEWSELSDEDKDRWRDVAVVVLAEDCSANKE